MQRVNTREGGSTSTCSRAVAVVDGVVGKRVVSVVVGVGVVVVVPREERNMAGE